MNAMDDTPVVTAVESTDYEREYYLLAGRFSVVRAEKERQELIIEEQKRVIAHHSKRINELEARLERAGQ